jgi:hypothetical protein
MRAASSPAWGADADTVREGARQALRALQAPGQAPFGAPPETALQANTPEPQPDAPGPFSGVVGRLDDD